MLIINLIVASIGIWTFIDQATNLRNTSAKITTINTPFVPALPDSSTNVISFLGHKDSYVVLENTGELAVSSFTWSAMIFPERAAGGPLFNWPSSYSGCGNHGTHIWFVRGLATRMCEGVSLSTVVFSEPLSLNVWHHVAVSYDANTGDAVQNVDGTVQTINLGIAAADTTTGPVVIGSRYYHSGTFNDDRSFQGKIACMRLWNIVRDLNTMRMDTPLCTIN